MYIVIWEFEVAEDARPDFEKIYGQHGTWVQFFLQDAAFLGTELLRDLSVAGRYITTDRWQSREAYECFRLKNAEEYRKLDNRFSEFTCKESVIGQFMVVVDS